MEAKLVKRGFVTIATGKKHYYQLAFNLLQSYRHFTTEPCPFAIIAEEENEYTAQFDDVIITSESTHSFLDKFLLLKLCPYDETIFFDADCLAYGDLNKFWDIFDNATDFSSIGVNVSKEQTKGAWYNIDDIGPYGEQIAYKVRVHSGICFIRRSEKLNQLHRDCLELSEHYAELHFHTCPDSKDECILGVAMPMNNMKAVGSGDLLVTFPSATYLAPDILNGRLQYKTPWQDFVDHGLLLHWGTAQTYSPLYQYEASCLIYMTNRKKRRLRFAEKIWYEKKLLYRALYLKSKVKKLVAHIKKRLNHLYN